MTAIKQIRWLGASLLFLFCLSLLPLSEGRSSTPAPQWVLTPTVIVRQIVDAEDDTSVREETGENLVDWTIVRLGQSEYTYVNGFRFRDINIPPDSTIQHAHLSLLYADWSSGLPILLDVHGENVNSSTSFSDANPLVSERELTSASEPWVINEAPTSWFDSPNLASVLQEVINRSGWQSGNSLSLIIQKSTLDTETHYIDVVAFDLYPPNSAELSITYQTPTPTSTPSLINYLPVLLITFPMPTPTPTITPSPTFTPTPITPTPTPTATPTLTPTPSFFDGPFEQEPNNSSGQANGWLRSGRDYQGYADDRRDWFSIKASNAGRLTVDLSDHSGWDVAITVYNEQLYLEKHIAEPGSPPPNLHLETDLDIAGVYYVRITSAGNYNTDTPYTLRVTYP